MPHNICIYPTLAEQQLLERKAAERGMSTDEFVAWLLREALTQADNNIRAIVKH